MRRAILMACVTAALAFALACDREERLFKAPPPESGVATGIRMSDLQPGLPGGADVVRTNLYEESAWAVAEGKRLYLWFNCVGCHAQGGGDIGPPLMDDKWIYGSAPQNVYETIVEGRPNGMPSFGGKIPEAQVWQLVAYVRSMSGLIRMDASPGRSDSLTPKPPEMMMKTTEPRPQKGHVP